MKQEEKELLLQDLCARLPYGVKVNADFIDTNRIGVVRGILNEELTLLPETGYPFERNIEYVKPYLFPMSSMTEEQKKEFIKYAEYDVEETVCGRHYEYYLSDYVGTPEEPICNCNSTDWCNKNNFDYRGFIEKGLALDATGLNIY